MQGLKEEAVGVNNKKLVHMQCVLPLFHVLNCITGSSVVEIEIKRERYRDKGAKKKDKMIVPFCRFTANAAHTLDRPARLACLRSIALNYVSVFAAN